MDDGTSVIDNGNITIDIPHSEVGLEAVVALADQETLEKEIDDDLRNAFDGICDGEESDPEEESLTDHESETESDDGDRDLHSDRYFTSEQYESSVATSSANPNLHQRNESDVLESDNEFENKRRTDDSYEASDHSYESGKDKQFHMRKSSQTSDEYSRSSVAELTSHKSTRQNFLKNNSSFVSGVTDHRNYKNVKSSNPSISAASDSTVDLHEEYRKLCILYESTCQELKQLKTEEISYRKETEQTLKSLRLRLDLLDSEKNVLTSSLQESQNLVSGYMQDKNKLLGEVVGLESQLSSMTKARDEIQAKLESSEVTIQMLERQLNELNRSGNMSRLRDHHNAILEEMKLRHEKDILNLKESIDQLQSKLNSKVQEAEELISRNSQLQRKYQNLQIEKGEWVNKMSQELEISQKKYQQYLESGTIEEVNRLKLQVQRLEDDKLNIEKENSILRDEIKSLRTELDTSEALQKMAFLNKKLHETDGGGKELNLQKELGNSLKNVRSLRSEKDALKTKLNELEIKTKHLHKKAESFESQYTEAKKKVKELEDKLNSLSSNESASTSFYEKKIKSLENELSDQKISLHDNTEKLKLSSANEKMLFKSNEELQKKMTQLVQKHAEDKIQAVERCREQLLELHENALQKEKEKIQAQAHSELKEVCFKYENKISELQEEIKVLNEGLYDSKNQFLALYKENQSLHSKLVDISKPKEREDIEKEFRLEYEQKLTEMKTLLIKQNKEYLAGCLQNEVEKAQMEWTKQKVAEIKDFVENTKQKLNDEFQNCLQKEQTELQKKLQTEKEKLLQEYAKKVKDLNELYEKEIDKLSAKSNQDTQSKWEKKLDEQKEVHENEVKFIQHQFENKLLQMENEMKNLKENIFAKSSENEELQKLKQDLILQQEKCQKEKETLAHAESALNENLKILSESEKKLHGKLKRYEQHVAVVKKHYQKKLTKLQSELSNFQKTSNEKQNELQITQEKYEQEILELKNKFKKRNSSRNSVTQTVEEVVPKQTISNLENKFFKCLMNISDGIRHYVVESKNRNAEKLQSALLHYHQQMSSRLFQDLSKDIHSFTPTVIIPYNKTENGALSKEIFEFSSVPQNLYGTHFKTSTPSNLISVGKHFEQAEKITNAKNMTSNNYSTTPNFDSQTGVKSIYETKTLDNSESKTRSQNLYNQTHKTPKFNIFNTENSLLTSKDQGGLTINTVNSIEKASDPNDKFDDISYDFLTLNVPRGLFDHSKMPGYRLQKGDHDENSENFKDTFPVKLFPS
ncbi:uncharacterized protein NPIL_48031 [Nephila pilipes]|uniref:Uncharacterized protein n=1 Tax=Nephila pilipes TaxID=299642 RepID=A0A8X6MR03_NEPPI|nr:uncharacterized protein NPIL_48031 [Nephila pilipes]